MTRNERSRVSKFFDEMERYGVAKLIFENPAGFSENRKILSRDLLSYCGNEHVTKGSVERETENYFATKIVGIPDYALERDSGRISINNSNLSKLLTVYCMRRGQFCCLSKHFK
jgi:hypothetical protein